MRLTSNKQALCLEKSVDGPMQKKPARKKRRKSAGKMPVASSSSSIQPMRGETPECSITRAQAPSSTADIGFVRSSRNVKVNGGTFNQTSGHQTNFTVHINGHGEDFNLLQHHSLASTPQLTVPADPSQLPVPVDPSSSASPPAQMTNAPDDIPKTYINYMSLKQRGFPLWIPEPDENSPMAYRRKGVDIGDVGVITESGGFSFLFNICRPSGDPINPPMLPEGFSPLYPPLKDWDIGKYLEYKTRSFLTGGDIMRGGDDPPFPGLSFQASNEGAVLTMPGGATALKLKDRSRMRAYAVANLENWYRYVNFSRGMEVNNGEIRLVTGCHKTKSWGMAAVAKVPQLETRYLEFCAINKESVPATTSRIPHYHWTYSGLVAQTQVGPDPTEIEALGRSDDSEESGGQYMNQCLFVHTLNLNFSQDKFDAIQRDVEATLLKECPRYQADAAHVTQNSHASTTTRSNDSLFQKQPANSGTITEAARVQDQHITTSVSPSAEISHPADLLNKEILRKVPHCLLVVTEDENWYSVFTDDDVRVPPPEEIVTRVFAAHDVVEEEGVAYLEPKDGHMLRSTGLEQMLPSEEVFPNTLGNSSSMDVDTGKEAWNDQLTPGQMQDRPSRVKKYMCPHDQCGAIFSTKYRLASHLNRFHTREQQVTYSRERCPFRSYYKNDLARHEKSCEKRQLQPDSSGASSHKGGRSLLR